MHSRKVGEMSAKDKDVLVLSSGWELYGFGGVFGISCTAQPGDHFYGVLTGGFDHTFDDLDEPLTPAERVELADRMIEAWMRYRNEVSEQIPRAERSKLWLWSLTMSAVP